MLESYYLQINSYTLYKSNKHSSNNSNYTFLRIIIGILDIQSKFDLQESHNS